MSEVDDVLARLVARMKANAEPPRTTVIISSQCAVCGGHIFGRAVAVLGNKDRTGPSGQISEPFDMFVSGSYLDLGTSYTMHVGHDGFRNLQLASATAHVDCFRLFVAPYSRDGDGVVEEPGREPLAGQKDRVGVRRSHVPLAILDKLYVAGIWRKPPGSPEKLWLDDPGPDFGRPMEREELVRFATMIGMPSLARLPTELVSYIFSLSEVGCLFWRAIRARVLRREMDKLYEHTETITKIPLSTVSSWTRGQPLVPCENAADTFGHFVFLVIDAAGIVSLERRKELPTEHSSTAPIAVQSCVYTHFDDRTTTQEPIMALYKYGRLRLVGLDHMIFYSLPFPPLEQYEPLPRKATSAHVVDLNACYGITFFVMFGVVHAWHIHRTPNEDAMNTFLQLDRVGHTISYWAFLPIQGDRILGLWIAKRINGYASGYIVAIRMERADDIVIGYGTTTHEFVLLTAAPNATVAYADHAPFLLPKQLPDPSSSPALANPPEFLPIADSSFGSADSYHSFAPLTDVQSIRLFVRKSDASSRQFLGMIVHYHNGSARVVGQCRLGIDPNYLVVDPAYIDYRPFQFQDEERNIFARSYEVVVMPAKLPSGEEGRLEHSFDAPPADWSRVQVGYVGLLVSYDRHSYEWNLIQKKEQ